MFVTLALPRGVVCCLSIDWGVEDGLSGLMLFDKDPAVLPAGLLCVQDVRVATLGDRIGTFLVSVGFDVFFPADPVGSISAF